VTIGASESIVDGLKSTIAQMLSNTSYGVRPTAIYANPVLLYLIDREMKSEFNVVLNTKPIEGGLTVKTLSTQAGDIPLILEWTLPERLHKLEQRVESHEQGVQRLKGLGGAFGALLTLVHLAIAWLGARH